MPSAIPFCSCTHAPKPAMSQRFFVSILSPHSAADCAQRLSSNLGKVRWRFGGGYENTAPFLGSVFGKWFTIRRRIDYQNSFAPMLYGRFSPVSGGTRISGVFLFHPLVMALTIAFVAWAYIGYPIHVSVMVAVSLLVIVALCLFLARRHVSEIRRFLEQTCGAESNERHGRPQSVA
jgi:hypothetical protein